MWRVESVKVEVKCRKKMSLKRKKKCQEVSDVSGVSVGVEVSGVSSAKCQVC